MPVQNVYRCFGSIENETAFNFPKLPASAKLSPNEHGIFCIKITKAAIIPAKITAS